MARRKDTLGKDRAAGPPRGRRGLSPAARITAAELAARPLLFTEPLLRRGTGGATLGFVRALRRNAQLPLSPLTRLTIGLGPAADLLWRHGVPGGPSWQGGRGAVAGHRELYLRLARLSLHPAVAPWIVALSATDAAVPGDRDATGAGDVADQQGVREATDAAQLWSIGAHERPVAHAAFAADVLSRWTDDGGVAPPTDAEATASPRALQRDLVLWLAAVAQSPERAPTPTVRASDAAERRSLGPDRGASLAAQHQQSPRGLPGESRRPGAPPPTLSETAPPGERAQAVEPMRGSAGVARTREAPPLQSHAVAARMGSLRAEQPALLSDRPSRTEDRRAILDRALARRQWRPSTALAGPPSLALAHAFPTTLAESLAQAGDEDTAEEGLAVGVPAYTALPELLDLAARLQRKAVPGGAAPTLVQRAWAVARAAQGVGAPLAPAERAVLARALDTSEADLGAVRVHTGAPAAEATAAVGAQAFTLGRDVFFAPGTYAPATAAGLALLGHEVAHTAQQGGVLRRALGSAVEPAELERQADEVEARVLRSVAAPPWVDMVGARAGGTRIGLAGGPVPSSSTTRLPGVMVARQFAPLWSAPADGDQVPVRGSAALSDAGDGIPGPALARQIERRWSPAGSTLPGAAAPGLSGTFAMLGGGVPATAWPPLAGASALLHGVAHRESASSASSAAVPGGALSAFAAVPSVPSHADVSLPSDVPGTLTPLGGLGASVLARQTLASGSVGGGAQIRREPDARVPPGAPPALPAGPTRLLAGLGMETTLAGRTVALGAGHGTTMASIVMREPDREEPDATALADLLGSRAQTESGDAGRSLAAVLSPGGPDMTQRLGSVLAAVLSGTSPGGGVSSSLGRADTPADGVPGMRGATADGGAGPEGLASGSAAQGAIHTGTTDGTGAGTAQAGSSAQPNVDDLVTQVLSRVRRQIALEHERAGGFLPDLLR